MAFSPSAPLQILSSCRSRPLTPRLQQLRAPELILIWIPRSSPSPVSVTFNLNTVGNAGTHQSVSDDYVHGAREAFGVGYGASDGSVTATTWDLNVTGKTFVELFTHGGTTTTTVNMTGTGSLTLFGVSDEFANVTTINDKASGAQVITGALQTDGSSKEYTGFLTDNTALTSITVTSTNAGNFVDMSGFEFDHRDIHQHRRGHYRAR